jgi:hypothetical protein
VDQAPQDATQKPLSRETQLKTQLLSTHFLVPIEEDILCSQSVIFIRDEFRIGAALDFITEFLKSSNSLAEKAYKCKLVQSTDKLATLILNHKDESKASCELPPAKLPVEKLLLGAYRSNPYWIVSQFGELKWTALV